jgi:hypothetical protein
MIRATLLTTLLLAAACATVQPVREPARFIGQTSPDVVHVTFKNHAKVKITQPRVSGDTLYGSVDGVSTTVAAPLSHIELIEALQRDRGRTTWLIVATGVIGATTVFALSQSGGGVGGCDPTYYRDPCAAGAPPPE